MQQPSYQFHLQQTFEDSAELYGPIGTSQCGGNDSGLDLRLPADITLEPHSTTRVDLMVRAVCTRAGHPESAPSFPFLLMARSSIGKTPIRLANSVGLIDQGYRGSLQVIVDNISSNPVSFERGKSLFQLVAPGLVPPTCVTVIAHDASLAETKRGGGGFGSTGSGGAQIAGSEPTFSSRLKAWWQTPASAVTNAGLAIAAVGAMFAMSATATICVRSL